MNKIEELDSLMRERAELNKRKKEINKRIKELENNNGKWIPKINDTYYFVNIVGNIVDYIYSTKCSFHDEIFKRNLVFKTKEEAQRYADYLKAKKKYSYEFSKEEFGSIVTNKYYIFYDYNIRKLSINYNVFCKRMGTTYFKSQEQAQEFIDKYKDDILKYEFGVEE